MVHYVSLNLKKRVMGHLLVVSVFGRMDFITVFSGFDHCLFISISSPFIAQLSLMCWALRYVCPGTNSIPCAVWSQTISASASPLMGRQPRSTFYPWCNSTSKCVSMPSQQLLHAFFSIWLMKDNVEMAVFGPIHSQPKRVWTQEGQDVLVYHSVWIKYSDLP